MQVRWLILMLVTWLMGAPVLADNGLEIWVSSSRDALALGTVAARYQASSGVLVTVTVMDPVPERFIAAAERGEAPDIILISHDRLGALAETGLISPINPAAGWIAGISPVAMQAVQFDGSTWGYPVSVEAQHLIYNRALIETPPSAFEDIPGLPLPTGNRRILWDYTNPYFTMPLLMAGGGYAFEKRDSPDDPIRTSIDTKGAIAGAEMLLTLINRQFLPPDMTYQIMDEAMNAGRVAMVIDGPWAWPNLAISGIDFGVAPIPSVGGRPSPSYVTVQALAISSASANRDLASSFIETALTSDAGLQTWNANGRLGALADLSAAAAQTDPHITAMLDIASVGVPLPDNTQMAGFWRIMRAALTDISTLAATPTEALNAAAARLNETEMPPDSG